MEEQQYFSMEKEVNHPVEKVFPQFNNLQNLTRWNLYFSKTEHVFVQYFQPYEGTGASLAYQKSGENKRGELYLRNSKTNQSINYQVFEPSKKYPASINIKFQAVGNKTKITWSVHTTKQRLIIQSENLFSKNGLSEDLDKSIRHLTDLIDNKISQDFKLASIRYDSIIIEQKEKRLLLGANSDFLSSKANSIRTIIDNHNKVYHYVTMDLAKREDEIGYPVLITPANHYKTKGTSCFYGIPLSRKSTIKDYNFSFRTINPSKYYTIYYKGIYGGHTKSIAQLLHKAQKDTMNIGELEQVFITPPTENEVIMQLSLPVYK